MPSRKLKMRILGIDPGLQLTGYGVIDYQLLRPKLIDGGVIRLKARTPIAERLVELETEYVHVQFPPEVDPFVVKESVVRTYFDTYGTSADKVSLYIASLCWPFVDVSFVCFEDLPGLSRSFRHFHQASSGDSRFCLVSGYSPCWIPRSAQLPSATSET